MQKVRQHCQALKIVTDYYDARFFRDMSFKQLEVVLPGGVRVIGLPANPQTARGFTGDVFLDDGEWLRRDGDVDFVVHHAVGPDGLHAVEVRAPAEPDLDHRPTARSI